MLDSAPQTIRKYNGQAVWDKTDGHCWYCGVQTEMTTHSTLRQYTIDHIASWRHEDDHTLPNLVPACRQCNARKSGRSLEAYRALLSRQGIPRFTEAHIAYLQQLGVQLPRNFPCYPVITFWFEREGLQA